MTMTASVLPLEEARRRILDSIQPLAPIELPLLEAHGCVLARDVAAGMDVPAFSSSEVEGYAVRAADVHGASPESPASLRVVGRIEAGQTPEATVGWGEAVRVGVGAAMPAGSDSVVPVEGCRAEDQGLSVGVGASPGQNVRPAGQDVKAGELLAPAGRRLGAPEIGLLAAAGYPSALAHPRVRVAVLTAGPGLVEPGAPAPFGAVRDSASYAVAAALRDLGAVSLRLGIVGGAGRDLREDILSNLSRADCLVGLTDDLEEGQLPRTLEVVGILERLQVAMYPGTWQAFGRVDAVPVFVLPSAPLSAFVSYETFVRPAVLKLMGRTDLHRPEVSAVLDADVEGPEGFTLVVPARVGRAEGRWRARPLGAAQPDLGAPLVRANGLVVIPAGSDRRHAGDEARVQVFRSLER